MELHHRTHVTKNGSYFCSGPKGAHLLRHSLATSMLRNGASLEDIGRILRHCHPETTQIYAKVDLDALRALAPAWPGGAA